MVWIIVNDVPTYPPFLQVQVFDYLYISSLHSNLLQIGFFDPGSGTVLDCC